MAMKTPSFEIIAGTYEEFLIGYYFTRKQSELVQSFASHNHSGSVRCIAVSGHYLASGAADDRIVVYDLKSRKEHCMLTHHDGTINCLKFTDNHSHLMSGSADGVLAIARVGNWQLEKLWDKAHKGAAILDIAIHSSGKLALTLGSDCSLRTWNLVKGRQAYIINLNSKSKDAKSLDKIVWAEDGVRFILYGGKYIEIWSIESGGILKVIENDGKVSSCIWLSDNEILVGCENGQIATVDINDCSKNIRNAHDGRVKALARYSKWIVSCSSSGEIKVWTRELKELAKQNSGCRITCLEIVAPLNVKKKEEEDVPEVVEEETIRNPIKRSSVVVEVEGSDNDSIIFNTEYEHDTNTSLDVKKSRKVMKKRKKRKSENVEEIDSVKKKKNEINHNESRQGNKAVEFVPIEEEEIEQAIANNSIEKSNKSRKNSGNYKISKDNSVKKKGKKKWKKISIKKF